MTNEPSSRYRRSAQLLQRAQQVIPLGTQTFSKSYQQFPHGAAPLFLDRGDAGRVWDVDGNEYVDLISALLPVVLGYRDPDVDRAIRAQMESGISFSLATELEVDLAERLVEIIPCAEMVRFGKNGSDATTACVRVARAFTKRELVVACGYHGWQDWYIAATTRNKGVPAGFTQFTQRIPYDDLGALAAVLREHRGNVAAVILEPMSLAEPSADYLPQLIELVHADGALVIFDEVITGFRFALGGAQEYFGVTPDLAAFGKALGNGMPISAVVGRSDVMAQMEEVFFSSTFGGETLSLAAAIAVIDKMRREPVVAKLWESGEELGRRTKRAIATAGLTDTVSVKGKPPWLGLEIRDHPGARKEAIRTLFLREVLRRGVLTAGTHNVSYAHTADDVRLVDQAYQESFQILARELDGSRLEENLGGPVIMPVFAVR